MNEITGTREMKKQGWVMRLLTAVGEKLLKWICLCEWGMSPHETRMFMIHSGFGWDEAMGYAFLTRLKLTDDREVSDAS